MAVCITVPENEQISKSEDLYWVPTTKETRMRALNVKESTNE